MDASLCESSLGYHLVVGTQREALNQVLQHAQVGSLTGGGRLPKSNGGAQRFSQYGREIEVRKSVKAKESLIAYRSSKDESRT